jgi:hypothetical protein
LELRGIVLNPISSYFSINESFELALRVCQKGRYVEVEVQGFLVSFGCNGRVFKLNI